MWQKQLLMVIESFFHASLHINFQYLHKHKYKLKTSTSALGIMDAPVNLSRELQL